VKREVTTERVNEAFVGTFECEHCGYETTAHVQAFATGAAAGKDDEAHAAARAAANDTAGAIASRSLMFVPCPSCGKRHPKAGMYRLQIVLASLGMTAAGFALLFLTLMKVRWDRYLGPWTPVVALAVGLLWGARNYWVYRRAWTKLDERVVLGSAAEPDAPSMRPL
jgi:hypothetical protein